MENVVKPGWDAMDKAADELTETIEPVIRSGIEKIIEVKEEAKDKVRGEYLDRYMKV